MASINNDIHHEIDTNVSKNTEMDHNKSPTVESVSFNFEHDDSKALPNSHSMSERTIHDWMNGVEQKYIDNDPFVVLKKLDNGKLVEERSNRMRAIPEKAHQFWLQRKSDQFESKLKLISDTLKLAQNYLIPEGGRAAKSHRKILIAEFQIACRLKFELETMSPSISASLSSENFRQLERSVNEFCEAAEAFITPSMSSTSISQVSNASLKDKREERAIEVIEMSVRSKFDSLRINLDQKTECSTSQIDSEMKKLEEKKRKLLEKKDELSKSIKLQEANAIVNALSTLEQELDEGQSIEIGIKSSSEVGQRKAEELQSQLLRGQIEISNANVSVTSSVTNDKNVSQSVSKLNEIHVSGANGYTGETKGQQFHPDCLQNRQCQGQRLEFLKPSTSMQSEITVSEAFYERSTSTPIETFMNTHTTRSVSTSAQVYDVARSQVHYSTKVVSENKAPIFVDTLAYSNSPVSVPSYPISSLPQAYTPGIQVPYSYTQTLKTNDALPQANESIPINSVYMSTSVGDYGQKYGCSLENSFNGNYNPYASEFVPNISKSNEDSIVQLGHILTDVLEKQSLPKQEIFKFSGEPLEFNSWLASFELLVNSKNISVPLKMFYLKSFLSGEALRAVQGCLLLNTESSYLHALSILKKRFGDPIVISQAFRTKMDAWPNIKEDDGVAFRDFSDFLTQCQAALTELPSLRIFEDTHYIRFMCEKLPKGLQRRWGRIADNILKSNSRQPNFKEFVEFVDTESSVCNNTAFGHAKEIKKSSTFFNSLTDQNALFDREDLNLNQNSVSKKGYGQNGRNQANHDKNNRVTGNKNQLSCPFCFGRHYADKCTKPSFMSKAEQIKLFSDHNLCTNCCRSHSSSTCTTKPFCGICKEKHFTFDHVNFLFSTLYTLYRFKTESK